MGVGHFFIFAVSYMHDQDIRLDLRPLKEKPNAPAKGCLILHVTVELAATEAPATEVADAQLDGPTVPAAIEPILSVGDVIGTTGGKTSATWTALEPLHGLLNVPALTNLVNAVDELAKVFAVICITRSALIPSNRSTRM